MPEHTDATLLELARNKEKFPHVSERLKSDGDWEIFTRFLSFCYFSEPSPATVASIAEAVESVHREYAAGAREIRRRMDIDGADPLASFVMYKSFDPIQDFIRRFIGCEFVYYDGEALWLRWPEQQAA